MSSLYLRGSIWWAMSYEQGKMIRWSLGTSDKREARPRLREFDSQPRKEPLPTRLKSPATWDTAAQELLAYYLAYGTRRVHEAERQGRTLSRYFTGWMLRDIDAAAIQGYVAHRRGEGKVAATVNLELATLRKALKVAHEHGKLDKLPVIHMLRPATPRSGFFEREQFEAVSRELPPDIRVVVLIGYTYGWMITSEVLPITWRQVDLEAETLRLDPGTTKNRDGRVVYLTPEVKDRPHGAVDASAGPGEEPGKDHPLHVPHATA